jgi:hypothetical protein
MLSNFNTSIQEALLNKKSKKDKIARPNLAHIAVLHDKYNISHSDFINMNDSEIVPQKVSNLSGLDSLDPTITLVNNINQISLLN